MVELRSSEGAGAGIRIKRKHYVLAVLFLTCIIIYYFGELVNATGLAALHWPIFYTVHDLHRLLFLVPIIYAAHHFRIEGAVVATSITSISLLPRAFAISPFPDSPIRTLIYIIISAGIGIFYAAFCDERDKRKQLEARIMDERDWFQTMLERLEDGILIIGPDYKIRFCNSRMIKDFGEGVGSYCYDYLSEQTQVCNPKRCKLPLVVKGTSYKWEYVFKDGRAFETIASPFVDLDGEVCQLTAIREITQRKRNEMELLGMSNLQSDILSNLSHELKTPLTSIKGIASGLLQTDVKFDRKTEEELFSGMLEETNRLDNLIGNLLDMSKLEAGILKPERKYFSISEIIDDAITRSQRICPDHAFTAEIEPNLPQIHAVYGQVMQVLTNLLNNAAAYSNGGTKITIRARKIDHMLEISVLDKGVGIPIHELGKIFQRFYRGAQSLKKDRSTKGNLGLGLAICQSIVLNHGGRIWAESDLGKGSAFHFTIPLASDIGVTTHG